MNRSWCRTGLFAMAALAACSSAVAQAKTDGARPPHTAADVRFMSGMIGHHAQAVLMAGWAVSHGAGPEVRRLCERIVVGQRDEIELMQGWLRERGEPVPDGDPAHQMMPGMAHPSSCPAC